MTGAAQVRRLAAHRLDIGEATRSGRLAVVVSGPRDRRILRAEGLRFRPAPRAGPSARAAAATSGLPSARTTYRDLGDYEAELARLAADHPRSVRPVRIGSSVQGRPIAGVEIAAHVNRSDGRPTHVELGLLHGREWSSGEVVMEFARELAAGGGRRMRRLRARERTFLFPVVNPDGFVLSRTTDPLQRKNAAEVDLNRNFGAFWGGPGASDDPVAETFRGPAPFSEPESRAVRAFASTHQVMVVNANHNYAGTVLYQPGFSRADEPGFPAGATLPGTRRFAAVARRMATAAGYAPQPAYAFYDVTGAAEDFNYFDQFAFVFTTEVGYDDFQVDYQDGVVDQYLGTVDGPLDRRAGRRPSRGVRELMLRAGEAALDARNHAILRGKAPPGARLRLARDVSSPTSYVLTGTDGPAPARGGARALAEHFESALTVPRSGRYVWHVNPSTRPLARLAGKREAWKLTCGPQTRSVVLGLGQSKVRNLRCGRRRRGQR